MKSELLIGIDGNEANVKHRAGVGQYSYEVLTHLVKSQNSPAESAGKTQIHHRLQRDPAKGGGNSNVKTVDQWVKYQIYLKDQPLEDLPEAKYKIFGPSRFWTQAALPIRLWRERLAGESPSVFFSPAHYAPRFCPVPSVISIMDLAFLRFPEFFKKRDLLQLKNWTAYSVKQAKKIIAISEATKKDILESYLVPEDKVAVTYLGYNRERFRPEIKNEKEAKLVPLKAGLKIKNITEKYKINSEYLIYLGTLQPRKNLVKLIRAFSELRNKDIKLVIAGMINVGRGGWMYEEIFKLVEELNLKRRVIFTNYVPDEEVPYLMAGAKAYILPSLYEGFGIPVLEAMAVGTPTIVSKVSSLPEIGGQASLYIDDPYSVDSIRGILEYFLKMKDNEVKEIVDRGYKQAEKFSWEKTANQTFQVLISAVE